MPTQFIKPLAHLAACAALLQGALWLTTAQAEMVAAKSSLEAVGKQMGVATSGRFKKFDAKVQFDPAKLAQASVKVDVDVGSYDIGDAAYNQELRGKTWFDAGKFPKASFVSSSIKAGSAGRYDVTGKFTLKGKTADVSFPMTMAVEGGQQVFKGSFPIKRTVFNVGEGEWKDTSMVADEVQIKFVVVNTK